MRILETMKKAVVFMLAVTALIACNKNTDTDTDTVDPDGWTTDGSPVGTWCLSSWSELSQAEVYLSFSEDGTFELYQRVYTPYYDYYSGTWQKSGGELSGTYSDGVTWGVYNVSFRDDEMRLILAADATDISYFVQGTIPDEALEYGNPDSKALGDSELSTDGGFFRNSGRFL